MNINVKQKQNGITAVLSGFDIADVSGKVEACKAGSCACDCDTGVMERIEDINITQIDGKIQIDVTGAVDAATIAPMMQSCLMGEQS